MVNDFQLSPLEKKGVLRDAKQLTSQNSLSIRYYSEGTFTPGMGGTMDPTWSNFSEYPSVIQEIEEFSSKRYDYGDLTEGDLILLLPYDTSLPTDAIKYEFKHQGRTFTAEMIQAEQLLDGTITHYYMVGKIL